MNDEMDPVEKLLAGMAPASLGNDLMARLTAARPSAAPARSRVRDIIIRWLVPSAAVACVALVTVKFLDATPQVPTPVAVASSPAKAMPMMVENHLTQAREMGVMVGPNRQPYQMMEYQWVEAETIVPGSNAPAIRLETTRRQIVPIQLEVY